MCTYATFQVPVDGSAKGQGGDWEHVDVATVYFDHPVHAMAEHTLNIDLTPRGGGPSDRVAMELTASSARALRDAIDRALASAPEALTV
jgi:hypothetical protein